MLDPPNGSSSATTSHSRPQRRAIAKRLTHAFTSSATGALDPDQTDLLRRTRGGVRRRRNRVCSPRHGNVPQRRGRRDGHCSAEQGGGHPVRTHFLRPHRIHRRTVRRHRIRDAAGQRETRHRPRLHAHRAGTGLQARARPHRPDDRTRSGSDATDAWARLPESASAASIHTPASTTSSAGRTPRSSRPRSKRRARLGFDCTGPHSPDTIFIRGLRKEFDLIVAMYHDQGHIPMKLIDFERDRQHFPRHPDHPHVGRSRHRIRYRRPEPRRLPQYAGRHAHGGEDGRRQACAGRRRTNRSLQETR